MKRLQGLWFVHSWRSSSILPLRFSSPLLELRRYGTPGQLPQVHQVNFLVAHHVRCPLCSKCKCLITENHMSGLGFIQPHPHQLIVCRLCSHKDSSQADDLCSLSSCSSNAESSSTPPPKRSSVLIDLNRLKMDKIVSSSSSVMELSSSTSIAPTSKKAKTSTTTTRESKVMTTALRWWPSSSITKNVEHSKAEEGILVSWCTKLGLSGMVSGVIVPVAVKACICCLFEWSVEEGFAIPGVPNGVALVQLEIVRGIRPRGKCWSGLRRSLGCRPMKLIFAAGESKLARVLSNKRRRRSKSNRYCHAWTTGGGVGRKLSISCSIYLILSVLFFRSNLFWGRICGFMWLLWFKFSQHLFLDRYVRALLIVNNKYNHELASYFKYNHCGYRECIWLHAYFNLSVRGK